MAWSPSKCLEQLDARDKDFRYMALTDLHTELVKDTFKVDADNEKKIVSKLLNMVAEDGSGDIKGLAVKCMGPMAARVQKAHVKMILEKLRDYLTEEKREDEVRDIASIGLKQVITELPEVQEDNIQEVVKTVPSKIIDTIANTNTPAEVVEHCLDVLDDLLKRWGKRMAAEKGLYSRASKAVSPHLTNSRSSVRKKAIACLARLAVSLPDDLFAELMDLLVKSIKEGKKADQIRTFLSAIGSVSRHVGFRMAKYLDQVVPILVQYADHPKFKEDDDMKETCFQAFESIILRCPKDADRFLDQILPLALKFMAHDPNLTGSDEEDGDEMDLEEDEDFEGEDYDLSDDDDLSWKVRKASTRCLAAIVKTHARDLSNIFDKSGAFLVKRFNEREENVKIDVYATFVEFLRQTAIVTEHAGAGEETVTDKIRGQVGNIVKALVKALQGKSEKTKVAALQLLRELVQVLPGCLEDHISALLPGIQACLDGKGTSSPIRIEALEFLRALFQTHNKTIFHPHLSKLTPPIYKAIGDKYSKIAAEGLSVASELAKIIPSKPGFDYAPLVPPLYTAAFEKLKQQDIDQEVKEVAIECMGLILSLLGDKIADNVPPALELLKDRLGNEVTRLVAVKTWDQIGQSKLNLNLGPVVGDVIKTLATFLRQLNRQLKLATLSALTTLIKAQGGAPGAAEQYGAVVTELTSIISESDLHLAHLGLRLAAAMVAAQPSSAPQMKEVLVPKCHDLLRSSFLQGMALDSMMSFYRELLLSNAKGLGYEALLNPLLALAGDKAQLSKQAFHSIAQCVATLVAAQEQGRDATVQKFLNDIAQGQSDSTRLLALFCIGEIGRRISLSGAKDIKKIVLDCFESSSEDIKSAASIAFGCLAVGEISKFLPDIISEMKANPKRQYLLLGSLRETIVRLSATSDGIEALKKYSDQLLSLLFEFTATQEEGNRNVVSECLGKMALIDANKVILALKERVTSPSAETRACVTAAIKAAITERPQPGDAILGQNMAAFLNLLQDPEIIVRKSVLLSLNYCAHLKPGLIRDLLPQYLSALYGETKIKKELIKEFEVGPFKHLIDTGTELRQAAFEAIYTLLETCLTRLDLTELMPSIASALTDTYDIQILAHMILARIAKKVPAALVSGLDSLVEPLRTAVNSKPKGEAVQQQIERHDDMIKSTLRTIAILTKVEGIDNAPSFQEFLTSAILVPPLADKYHAVVKELSERQ